MKKLLYSIMVIALSACTAEQLPEKSATEKVSINVRLAEPTTKAIINDSGSGAASFFLLGEWR